jgi:RND family efflux transporter MFP subunit
MAMAGSGAIAPAERDAIAAEAKAARSAVAAAQASARALAHEAREGVIRAPGDGVVAERFVEVGSVVAPGQKLFAITGAGEKVIFAAAPHRLADSLKVGRGVSWASETHKGEGTVIAIAPEVADGGVVPIRIRIKTGAPLAGSVVRVSMTAGTADGNAAVRVPAGAVLLDQQRRPYVYRVAGGKADRVRVSVIGLTGSEARITGKIAPGQSVIAAGGAFVAPGQAVTAARPGA